MKNKKTLEQKIDETEAKMPGIKDLLKPKSITNVYYGSEIEPIDVEYAETEISQIVGANWKAKVYGYDCTRERECLRIYYRKKGEDEIKQCSTPWVDLNDESKPFEYVRLETLSPNRVRVSLCESQGSVWYSAEFEM